MAADAHSSRDGPEYEFEDPAQAWIALVEACRILDVDKRKQALTVCLNEAKNSHWSEYLYDTELDLEACTAEYGGPFPGEPNYPDGSEPDTEPYSDEEGRRALKRSRQEVEDNHSSDQPKAHSAPGHDATQTFPEGDG